MSRLADRGFTPSVVGKLCRFEEENAGLRLVVDDLMPDRRCSPARVREMIEVPSVFDPQGLSHSSVARRPTVNS